MTDITLRATREKLHPRRAPYWHSLGEGRAIGFRRGPDTWQARHYGADGRHRYQTLGHCEEWDEAVRRARVWFDQVGEQGLDVQRGTVREALLAYVADLGGGGRRGAAKDILSRLQQLVWGDPLACVPLERLTLQQVKAWRERIQRGPVERSADTINRYVAMVAAGLTRATELGFVGHSKAWKLERLTTDREESEEPVTILTPEQRAALLLACPPEARAFFAAIEATGARPREIAAARVVDFNRGGRTLTLSHRKGLPFRPRPRDVVLSGEAFALVERQAEGRRPVDWLFPAPGGARWERHMWAQAFRRAAASAQGVEIPGEASTYDLRHTRISELLQLHGIDPVTVAKQCGTSVAMIELHYHSFIKAAMQEKLAAL